MRTATGRYAETDLRHLHHREQAVSTTGIPTGRVFQHNAAHRSKRHEIGCAGYHRQRAISEKRRTKRDECEPEDRRVENQRIDFQERCMIDTIDRRLDPAFCRLP
ncbi:hypothetical protein [Burkholderia stabilis]|uniref:hypothetical protein n=1 Tax=Burkholderia stabilis TaxID=95485 RepID=UPI001F4A7700|nr:hypothetical protein [Burkholderia stabilis]